MANAASSTTGVETRPRSLEEVDSRAGAIDSDLTDVEVVRGLRPADQHVRIRHHRDFRRTGPGHLVPREGLGQPQRGLGRVFEGLKRALVGRPLATWEEPRERVNIFTGLAV